MNVKWIVDLLFWKIFKLSVFHTLCDRIHPTKSLYHLLNPSSHLNWPYVRTMVGSSEFHPKLCVYFLFLYDLIHKNKLFWGSNSQKKASMCDTVWWNCFKFHGFKWAKRLFIFWTIIQNRSLCVHISTCMDLLPDCPLSSCDTYYLVWSKSNGGVRTINMSLLLEKKPNT